jgi:hypothetical protein
MLPDDFGSGVTLEALRALVPTCHKPVRIDHVDCIVDYVFDEEPISAFVVRQVIVFTNQNHLYGTPNLASMHLFP